MKKVLLVAVVFLMTSMLVFAGGGGDKGSSGGGAEPYIVDISKMTYYTVTNNPDKLGSPVPGVLRNQTAISKNWEDVMFLFPEDMPDLTGYSRVTVTVKYLNKDRVELPPRDSMGMASMIYDLSGDWRGPEMGSGPNHAFKEFNVGGFSGMLHKERGVRVGLKANPKALLVQKAQDASVAYIELSGIIFHNGNFKFTEEQPQGEGPEGSS